MKNKTTKILLIVLVILIWGTVAFRFYLLRTGKGFEYVTTDNPSTPTNNKRMDALDTFNLFLDYPDPFLHDNYEKVNALQRPSGKKKDIAGKNKDIEPQVTSTSQSSIPNGCDRILFLGVMSKAGVSDLVARIKIDNTSYSLKMGESAQECKLILLTKSEAHFMLEDRSKCIKKKN